MTLADFEQLVFAIAAASPICDIPATRHLTAPSIHLRVGVTTGGFIDAFYNEQPGTTAFALIHPVCTQIGLPGPHRHCTMGVNPKGRREGLILTNSSRL